MEDWVLRAIKRWPNVPALFGWLRLDRRGRWLIKGEHISRVQIIDTINRNYSGDDQGRWFFQNGPQRGYVQLEHAPLVLRATGDSLTTHTDLPVTQISAVYMDEAGALLMQTEHGPGALIDDELEWALQRMRSGEQLVDEVAVATALALPSHAVTALSIKIGAEERVVTRLDTADAPAHLRFQRDPHP